MFPCGSGSLSLEKQFHRKLHYSWIARRRRNLPELIAVRICIRQPEMRRVEQIERLRPQLHADSFGDLCALDQRDIEIGERRPANIRQCPGDVSERERSGNRKCGRIEPLQYFPLARPVPIDICAFARAVGTIAAARNCRGKDQR